MLEVFSQMLRLIVYLYIPFSPLKKKQCDLHMKIFCIYFNGTSMKYLDFVGSAWEILVLTMV